jgi:hypothetical protein
VDADALVLIYVFVLHFDYLFYCAFGSAFGSARTPRCGCVLYFTYLIYVVVLIVVVLIFNYRFLFFI